MHYAEAHASMHLLYCICIAIIAFCMCVCVCVLLFMHRPAWRRCIENKNTDCFLLSYFWLLAAINAHCPWPRAIHTFMHSCTSMSAVCVWCYHCGARCRKEYTIYRNNSNVSRYRHLCWHLIFIGELTVFRVQRFTTLSSLYIII